MFICKTMGGTIATLISLAVNHFLPFNSFMCGHATFHASFYSFDPSFWYFYHIPLRGLGYGHILP